MDLIPEVNMQVDFCGSGSEAMRTRLEDGTKIMATAARAEERTRISTFQSTLAETHKGNLQLATVFKKITQLSSGLEPIFQHVGVAIQSMQNIAQAFPSYHRSEGRLFSHAILNPNSSLVGTLHP